MKTYVMVISYNEPHYKFGMVPANENFVTTACSVVEAIAKAKAWVKKNKSYLEFEGRPYAITNIFSEPC